MNNARGKKLLSVSGVLLIVFGVVTLAALVAILVRENSEWAFIDFIALVLWIICGGLGIFAGGFGIKNRKVPEKAQHCAIMGSVLIVSMVAMGILTLVFAGEELATTDDAIGYAVVCFVSLIFPVLYLIGALRNKKSLVQNNS
jgi:peptidoglycan/LPS O-acetylase OafA/YrhL